MSFADFMRSVETHAEPPAKLTPSLAALWYDRRDQWETAHGLVQKAAGKDGAWVHAYLHRKEGDEGNAGYWYRLAGRPVASDSLSQEWGRIVRTLLDGMD